MTTRTDISGLQSKKQSIMKGKFNDGSDIFDYVMTEEDENLSS
jgi:hypothetical protein